MTVFRANAALWSQPSSSIPNVKEDSEDKKEIEKARPSRKKFGNSSKDNEHVLEVELSTNALLCIAHSAIITTSLYNGDGFWSDKDGEGVVLSTKPTVAGPFVMLLYGLQKQQMTENDKIEENSENCGQVNPIMFATFISDGTKSCRGMILQTKDYELSRLSECIVSISGYVMGVSSERDDSSRDQSDEKSDRKETNSSNKEAKRTPFIFITRYEILYEKRSDSQTDARKCCTIGAVPVSQDNSDESVVSREIHIPKSEYQNRGGLATFISSSKLHIDDFAGISNEVSPEDSFEVANFIEQHTAIMALEKRKENASLLSSSSFSLVLGSLKHFQNYASAIKEFDEGQREEQFVSLSDMEEEFLADDFVIREGISDEKIARSDDQSWIQHKETLEYALLCKDEALSSELLLRWHAWLLGDGLEQEAGVFRSERTSKNVDRLCDTLEKNWIPKIKEEPANPIRLASFAAAVMLAILDLVPFQVGNQRLARIILNWTLRRAGFPFCVTLYSNQSEKTEFSSAVERTRQNLCLVPQGHVEEYETAAILRSTGGLGPLVGYLIRRLAQGIADLCLLVEQKSKIAADETDARLVRMAREKAAAEGTCIICFENQPNIATLCCGKPIHLNCLAEWLKTKSSCPQCRSDIPLLSVGQERCQRVVNRRGSGFTSYEVSSSSSSSDDSSSSSSSSSSSESFFYSGLANESDVRSVNGHDQDGSTRSIRSLLPPLPFPSRSDIPVSRPLSNYADIANYVTSDEEDEGGSDDDDSSIASYQTNTDDDRHSFHTNASQRSQTYYDASNFDWARSDDGFDIVSDTQSQSIGNAQVNDLGSEDGSADGSDFSFGENQVSLSPHPAEYDVSSPDNVNFEPLFRVSFLDPELLGSVQSQIYDDVETGERDDGDAREIQELAADDVHPFNSDSCDFPLRRRQFPFSRRSRWS